MLCCVLRSRRKWEKTQNSGNVISSQHASLYKEQFWQRSHSPTASGPHVEAFDARLFSRLPHNTAGIANCDGLAADLVFWAPETARILPIFRHAAVKSSPCRPIRRGLRATEFPNCRLLSPGAAHRMLRLFGSPTCVLHAGFFG